MVHADRERPQPVEVISGRHFNLIFSSSSLNKALVSFNDHRAHIYIVSHNALLCRGTCHHALGWGWGFGKVCLHFALH